MSGVVVWFTGLPSSGKTTLARAVLQELRADGISACLLDSDEVRDCLRPKPGYDPAAREAFYDTLGRLAGMLAQQGQVALVAATAHRREYRDRARTAAPRFIEVFVDTPLEACEKRDAKGLYEQARQGPIRDFPGVQAPYERPAAPDVRATAESSSANAVRQVLTAVRSAVQE